MVWCTLKAPGSAAAGRLLLELLLPREGWKLHLFAFVSVLGYASLLVYTGILMAWAMRSPFWPVLVVFFVGAFLFQGFVVFSLPLVGGPAARRDHVPHPGPMVLEAFLSLHVLQVFGL